MNRILVLLCLVSCATLEMESVKSYHSLRQTRANLDPVKSDHVHSDKINKPTIPKFYNNGNKSEDVSPYKGKYNMYSNISNINRTKTEYTLTSTEKTSETNRSDYPILAESNVIPTYDVGPVLYPDIEDIRSDSRSYYYNWPYTYHTPYEYDKLKYDIEAQKAKDKRFIESKHEKVIPVHEDIDDIPNSYIYTGPDYVYSTHNKYKSDNPIFGNKPFFSYILSDYFDKSYVDEDPLHFKDISWGKEFDKESLYQDMSDYNKQNKDQEDEYPNHFENKYLEAPNEYKSGSQNHQNKKYNNNNDFDAIKRASDYQQSNENGKRLYANYLKDFKDFTDSFANKFGSEGHNKYSEYAKKNNGGKGEKKKGLRKVFHKDEYQEQTESFDNTDKSSNSEEHGASSVGSGGSRAYLRSMAAASLGHEGNPGIEAEDVENNFYGNKYHVSKPFSDVDNDLSLYKDVAKRLATSNNNKFNSYVNY